MSQVLYESCARCNQSVATEVTCQTALNVVLLVIVVAKARAFGQLIIAVALTTTIPVEVGPQRRCRKENLDARVIMTSQRLVRVINLHTRREFKREI